MDNCIYCGIWDVPFTKYKGMCLQIFVKKEHILHLSWAIWHYDHRGIDKNGKILSKMKDYRRGCVRNRR